MKNTVTNSAEITVLAPIEYNTYKTGGGPVSVGATVVRSPKGPPNQVLRVTQANWQNILGKPYSKKEGGAKMEGLRHVADAILDCNYVNVVRVLAADAKFPSLTLNDDGEAAATVTAASHAFGTALTAGADVQMVLWVIDGDDSTNRSVVISDIDDTNERFTITFKDEDENGDEYILEQYKGVGIGVNDINDMGQSAFIETVLENNSNRFRCDFNTEDFAWAAFSTAATAAWDEAVSFTGGTDGGDPSDTEWEDAWDLFRNPAVNCDLMFAAGNTVAAVLANCIEIAELRHCTFLFDLSPSIKHDAAITALAGYGVESRQAAVYHAPFAADDRWYGGKTVWGVSGEMASACARGDQNYTGEIPGIHYAPAGEKRAKLKRTGIVPLFADDILDRDALYTARINPVIPSTNGGAVCDDALALYNKENYSRFIWVNRIGNYIDHRFYQAASAAKFEPDGLTYDILYRLTKEIMEDLVTSGAIVKPRDVTYGDVPYIITIEQLQIDLWQVTWEFCPTGAARRIVGQPKLIK